MPKRFLPHDRYQVIGAFVTIVLISVGLAVFFDYRIDQAEERITANTDDRALLKRAFTISLINQCNKDANQNFTLRRAATRLGVDGDVIGQLPPIPRGGRRDDGTWIGCGNYPPPLS